MASPHWKLAAPVLTLVLSSACVQAQPLRALVLSGANNHDWTQTTPALEQILEDSGRFEVDVTDDPSSMTADSLAAYDLVISNWTNWPEEERVWGEEAEKALLDFVRSGKGFSLFHAASACFSEWPEYQRLIGATWDKAATGHGAIHSFPVTITDHKHPITRGLPDFSIRDELWHKMAIQPKARALCAAESFAEKGGSGADEPVVLVSRFGNGRSFYLTLGHDVAAMDTLGWRMLMLRGAEWAATGRVTTDRPIPIEAALDRASDYTRHEDRGKLVGLDLLVQQAGHDAALREELAASLAAHLTSNATSDAKALFLGKLSVVGGPSDVSAMAALLTDEALDAAALFALERMPGKAATVALREAALDLSGASLAGAIAALGERGDAASAVLIAGHAAGDDPTVALAAIDALGSIGTPATIEALQYALSAEHGDAAAAALLRGADGARRHDPQKAAEAYALLTGPAGPASVRAAAFAGMLTCRRAGRRELLLDALRGDDAALRSGGIRALRELGGGELTSAVAETLSDFAPAVQIQAIVALHDLGEAGALDTVEAMLASDDPEASAVAAQVKAALADQGIPFAVTQSEDLGDRGPNLALGATATSPDDIDGDGAAGGDAAAIDGDPETYWDEVDDLERYRLVVTFPEARTVAAIRITGWGHHNFAPRDFEVICDGEVVKTVRDAWYESNRFSISFPATECSTLELSITGRWGPSPAIRELEIYGPAGQ